MRPQLQSNKSARVGEKIVLINFVTEKVNSKAHRKKSALPALPSYNIYKLSCSLRNVLFALTKAKFRSHTSHELNRMQMRKILCSPLLAIDSALVKYGV